MRRPLILLAALCQWLTPVAFAAETQVQRGEYLVELLACGACHTDGQLINDPNNQRYLAGSSVGIAYSTDDNPGIVYPANLTSDKKTGLGSWTAAEIRRNIQNGIDKHGRQQLPIMPWPGYKYLTDEDADAITAYLMSLPPVSHAVPPPVEAGTPSTAPYVRFGVYIFYPNTGADAQKPD